jgi:hypothetical protein
MRPHKTKIANNSNADGRRMLRMALGGGAGGLLGMALGAGGGLFSEAFLGDPKNSQYIRKALQGAGIGGLAGVGLGAGFGATNKAKHLHYAAEEKIDDLLDVLSRVRFVSDSPLGAIESKVTVADKPEQPPRPNN